MLACDPAIQVGAMTAFRVWDARELLDSSSKTVIDDTEARLALLCKPGHEVHRSYGGGLARWLLTGAPRRGFVVVVLRVGESEERSRDA